jgi:hypothetical protein
MPLAHVAGVPVEEVVPVLVTGAPLILAGLYRSLSTKLSRLRPTAPLPAVRPSEPGT